MIYNTYGKTGVEVSAIGFGGMRFADQDDVEGSAAVVKAAYDAGITYFDTAPGYGKSEALFGAAFKEMTKTREERPFLVSTKTFGSEPAAIRRDLETSLERMGLDHVDFLHMWCVMSPDAYAARTQKGALKEFERLKDEGLVRHVCVSSHMTGTQIGDMLRDYPFEGVLLGYSVMNFAYREAGIKAAAELGLGVVVMNPLGGGIVAQHPERFEFVKTREDATVVESALHFLLNDPRITVSLVGFSSVDQVRQAVHAVETFRPIPEAALLKIRGSLKQGFNELCTGCRYCDSCPQGIPVPKMMEAYNHYMLSGDPGAIVGRLRMHWGIQPDDEYVDACVECGKCEEACTQKLPITDRLKEIRGEAEKYLAAKKE